MVMTVEKLIPIFLCGFPKSGTTLLLSLLDSHPELLVFPEELNFFQKVLCGKNKQEKLDKILNETDACIPSLGKVGSTLTGMRDYTSIPGDAYMKELGEYLENAVDDREMFLAIFENWKQYSNLRSSERLKFFVEKTPRNEFYHEIIENLFPNARYVYIVRDPRDNYVSYKKKKPKLSLEKFVYSWQRSIRIALKKEGWLLIKYEDLISEPETTVRTLCNFLSIEFDEILLSPTKNGQIWKGNSMFGDNHVKIHQYSYKRYLKHLTKDEIQTIEGYLYNEMKCVGYKPDFALKENAPIKYKARNYIRALKRYTGYRKKTY